MPTDTPTLLEALDAVIAASRSDEPQWFATTLVDGRTWSVQRRNASGACDVDDLRPFPASHESAWARADYLNSAAPVSEALKEASANLSRHAPQIKAMVEENERLRKAVADLRMKRAGAVGLLAECALHNDEDRDAIVQAVSDWCDDTGWTYQQVLNRIDLFPPEEPTP